MTTLTKQQQNFGKLMNIVNGKLMFAYLENECKEHEFKFIEEDGKCYPKSWASALQRLESKGVINGYIVGSIDGVNCAIVSGYNPNAEYHNSSRQNIANYYLDIKGLAELPSDEFKFTRKQKERKVA